jgi:hypothetical protein
MSTEIDLVAEFLKVIDPSQNDLAGARSALDDAIASESDQRTELVLRPSRPRRGRRRPLPWSIGAGVAAAIIGVAVILVVPSARMPSAPAAAAEIARLADVVPPVPPLGPGQWYQYQLQGAITANVSSGTTTAPIASTATIPIAIGEWSNTTSAVCTSEQFGTVTFATAADAKAWQTMGLVTTPANQPATGCGAGIQASPGIGGMPIGPIDVTNLTHDPATLATELQNGTTGIGAIDHYLAPQQFQDRTLAFRRLTKLLVGPIEGQWSGFGQEMLRTLSRLPGIISLGTMGTHSGGEGLAFSMPTQVTVNPINGTRVSSSMPPTLILDPQDGTLLEVRNLDYPVLQSAAQDFVGSPNALVYSDGVGYGTTAAWIDPVSGLQAIDSSSVPGWISSIHIIEAVTAPSTTESQLSQLINPYLGNGNMDAVDDNVPAKGQETDDITIMGSLSTAQNVATSLTASGLFTSVSIKL